MATRTRYLTFIFETEDDGSTRVKCRPLGIDIVQGTLGQAKQRLGNLLKTIPVPKWKKALE